MDKLLRWPTTIPPRTSPSFSELQDCSGICCARSPLRRCAYWRLSQKPRRLRTFCVEVCSAHIRQRSRARPAIASPIPATTSPARPRFAGGKALRQTAWGGRQHLRNRFRGASRMWLERPERLRPCDGACGERRCASVSLARAPLPRGANLVRCSMLCVGRECVDAARDLAAMVNMRGASIFIFLLHFTRSKCAHPGH